MAKYTITPWRSQSDLLRVRAQLYDLNQTAKEYQQNQEEPEEDSRRHAVNRIMAWKLRGNLPHAVESTALLTDALLNHNAESPTATTTAASIFSIRAVYSAAFTRFVTGFCDIGRNRERSLEPSSMLDIAKQIGMPVHFVALRHEATHEELPALQRLVKVTEEGMKWLWDVYWSRLDDPESEEAVIASLPQVKTDARQLLRSYKAARLEALRSKKRGVPDEERKLTDACSGLMGKNKRRMHAFAEVLVQEKFLSPSKREVGSPLDGAFLLWDSLLKQLGKMQRHFTDVLVANLLQGLNTGSTQQPEQDTAKDAQYLWLVHIQDWESRDQLSRQREMMEWCCMNPGYWSGRLGKSIFEGADAEFEDDWREIFEASRIDDAAVAGAHASQPLGNETETEAPSQLDDIKLPSWIRLEAPGSVPIGRGR